MFGFGSSSRKVQDSESQQQAGVVVGDDPLHTASGLGSRTLEEQKELLRQQLQRDDSRKDMIHVEGGRLSERMRLWEQAKQKAAGSSADDDATVEVTDELIRDRVKWLQERNAAAQEKSAPTTSITVEGGNLQDRMRLWEEQKKKDAERLNTSATDESQVTQDLIRDRLKDLEEKKKLDANFASHATDESQVTQDLIRERLKDLEERRKQDATFTSSATDESRVTQDLIRDRLKQLEEQRKRDAMVASNATDESEVTQDLIRDRLKDLEEQRKRDSTFESHATDEIQVTQDLIRDRLKDLELQRKQISTGVVSKEAIVVEGANLKERLELLEYQRHLDAEQGRHFNTTDPSFVTYDFVRGRLGQIQELMNADTITEEEKEAVIVEGGKLADRLEKLERQRQKDSDKLASYTSTLSNVTDDLIRDRLQWIEKQSEQHGKLPEQAQSIVSHDLVAERMTWLKESAAKANALPEKERLEATRDLVKQRQAWLDEAKQKAAELPKKEKIEVTQGLLSERIAWLEAEKEKASSLNHAERVEMTTGLIAERLEWLERQYALDASEDIEMQITFLAEQKAIANQMTHDEQLVMTNALLDEKKQDLQAQKELTADLTDDQINEVANLLIDDRQAWLEGNEDQPTVAADEPDGLDEDDPVVAESSAAMQEVADSISFWNQQRKIAASMNAEEKTEITSLLIQEHIAALEQSAEGVTDDATRESITMQIEFLREQNANLDSIDHEVMINALIDEKIAQLEQRLAALYERVSSLCVIS